jgi:hypothetical protein
MRKLIWVACLWLMFGVACSEEATIGGGEDGGVVRFAPDVAAGDDEVWPARLEVADADGEIWCEKPGDCPSGVCLPQTGQCARPCVDGCPADMACLPYNADGPDQLYFCLPSLVPFCRPCVDDEQCHRYPGDAQTFCALASEDAGSFCTALCESPLDCPAGHACTAQGMCQVVSQCDCLAHGDNAGYVTTCAQSNEWGSCAGQRTCEPYTGLSSCQGPVPEAEICDGFDNDCDGEFDEDHASEACTIINDFGICPGLTQCLSGKVSCSGPTPEAERCDGLDNDCDGVVDEEGAEGCLVGYADGDGDGYGGMALSCTCEPAPGSVANDLDCDDLSSVVFPGASESCDGVDNDCDGTADELCDVDGDGYCHVLPMAWGPGYPCLYQEVDCNDGDGSTYPGAAEACDGLDNSCDGIPDEGCDADGDGFCGKPASAWGPGLVCQAADLDCNDADAAIHPGASDGCNAQDDDCNGLVDDGCDLDGDGVCPGQSPENLAGCAHLSGPAAMLCAANFQQTHCPNGFGDCNDLDPTVHPGALELCDNLDNDCDGLADDGLDGDGDGFCAGPDLGPGCLACPLGFGDCADDDETVHPAALDLPDLAALDTNCDGIDGSLSACVFVDGKLGKDYAAGTIDAPKATIAAALSEVVVDIARNCILVAQGSYFEPGLIVPPGVHLWGGYASGSFGVAAGVRSQLQGGAIALRLLGTAGSASVGRMDVSAASGKAPGESSVGIVVHGLEDALLADLKVSTGSGAPGQSGATGGPGQPGMAGEDGSKGCLASSFCGGGGASCQLYANGAMGAGALTCGGYGQGKSVMAPVGWKPEWLDEFDWSGGKYGEPSCCFKKLGPAAGGAPGQKGKEEAGDATHGQPGVSGPGGAGGDGAGTSAWLSLQGMSMANGQSGHPGSDGCGGGGGGKGDNYDSWLECEQLGGGGGGGGSGGTGGLGGTGGHAGGSAVGILFHKASGVVLHSQVSAGPGGAGGAGGMGGNGGVGGAGGLGGKGLSKSGHGGNGGHGGAGGGGGGGGGGRGGNSVALAMSLGYAVEVIDSTLTSGSPGKGGKGGSGGLPGGKVGANGLSGVTKETGSFQPL